MPATGEPATAGLPGGGPPAPPRFPHVRELHGGAEADEYAWMSRVRRTPASAGPGRSDGVSSGAREPGSTEFLAYLAAERAYYDAQTEPLRGLTDELYREAASRVPDRAEESVRWPLGRFEYWTQIPAGGENRQFLRAPAGRQGIGGTSDGRRVPRRAGETLLLDENALAAVTGFIDVGVFQPSPDGRLLAWSADTTGAEIYRLRIRDVESGQDLPDLIERSYPGCAWSSDSRYLFYLVPDDTNRPFQVWRHRVGSDPGSDRLALAEPDARFELTLRSSRSAGLILITAESRDTTEVRFIPAAEPEREPALVEPRRAGVEYRADHAAGPDGGTLYLVTNDGAAEFRLMRTPVTAPGRANWAEVACAALAPARADTRLHACDVFRDRLLLTLRRAGSPLLAIARLDGGDVTEVSSTMTAGSIRVDHAEDYDAGSVIVAEESLTEPPVWSRLDLATGRRSVLKRREVPGYEPARYATARRSAPALDGTAIPVTLAYRADTPLDGSAPCLLYGYGAYEACTDPEFDLNLPSLLDRGAVYAIAHVRGGGEGGRRWWLEGRLHAKPNTFGDFIAVANWLAGDPPASPAGPAERARPAGSPVVDGRRIISRGLSAGGLLQGAVYSQAPGRWRAVIAEVPFVDCVNSMLDPSIPLTITEWDEWGDPRKPDDYAVLRSYSPYENPPPGSRPDLLVTGALHDPRVLVHEPAKWVARLRHTDTAGSAILFRAELGAGAHTGPSGRFAQLRYEAEILAFCLHSFLTERKAR
jgi:oligopeptidase B